MRIVILINQTKQALLAEIRLSRLAYWLKRASLQSLETSDVWSKLYHAFGWSENQSLAQTLASRSKVKKIKGPCLIATPVKVVLGMRDSESHSLNENDSIITQSQLHNFNEFFAGIFQLRSLNRLHYLLEFNDPPDFILARHYWPPYLGDYRVQVQAAQGELVRHLTELQAWCHQQDSVWNALYLWSTVGQASVASVSVDDRTRLGKFSLLKLLSQDNNSTSNDQIIAVDDLNDLESTLLTLEAQCKEGQIDKLSISFADTELYQLGTENFKPWWKKLTRL